MHAYQQQESDLLSRLRRIEGQVRGIQKMIEEGRYCVDILAQIASVKAAAAKVELILLESHVKGCLSDALRGEEPRDKIEELVTILRSVVK